MASPEMIAAVSAAVKGETPPSDPPAVADPPADSPAATDPPADPPAVADPPADPPAADAPAAPVADEQGRVRGPDGKFVSKDPAAASKPAAEPEAAKPAAAPPKPADPINDPIPPNAKPETRERITTLANLVKEKDTELTTTRGDLDLLLAPVNEAGATVEQFHEVMALVKLINSPHQHDQMQALQYLQGAGATLAERLGHVPPGTDPLTGFPDLAAQVQANPALRKVAEEAARGRRLEAATQQQGQQAQQRTQQTAAQQREAQEGQNAVREVEQSFAAVDPLYKAKVAIMQKDQAFLTNLRSLPPKQWATAFSQKYRTVEVAASAAAPAGTPGAPAPLRAKQPAGTAAKPPGSMLEAVRGALKVG